MKPNIHNKYGYKVCYIRKRAKIPIKRFITYTYDNTKGIKEMYYKYPPSDDENKPIVNVKWEIYPISRKEVINGIWKECPF